jgi:trehalose-6-phosphatase
MTRVPAAGGSRESDVHQLLTAGRLARRPLVLLLDVDGTLAPIVVHPALAQVPDATRRVIASLVTRPRVTVILVSGRAAHDAKRMVGVERVWAVGNHGAEVINPSGDTTVDPEVSRYAEPMARTAQTLEPLLAAITGVVPRLRGIVEGVAERNGLLVTEGKKVLEIRPPVAVDKGLAISRLLRDLAGFGADGSILFAGDDATDEDAFRFLREHYPAAVTIHIGDRSDTAAEFTFPDLDQLRVLLERLAGEASERR